MQYNFSNLGMNGHNTWANLVRLTDTSNTHSVILDHANDANSANDKAALEAFIRRIWTANPLTRITFIQSPSWLGQDTAVDANVDHPTNEAAIGNVEALAAQYGIPVIGYWNWCKTVVGATTYHLNELTADAVHPSTSVGYPNMALLLEETLPEGGAQAPNPLPARIYDNGDYENTPVRINGSDETSRTGTWSENGTSISSSTADSTITYTATCQSYGVYRVDGVANPAVQVSIDGGAFGAVSITQNGIAIPGARALHTITIKVVSGTAKIDEFWAI